MSISLRNLNAFIIETLTIDYGYLWEHMEFAIIRKEALLPMNEGEPWRSRIDWSKVQIVPFSHSKIGNYYLDNIRNNDESYNLSDEPHILSFELYQSALTDLLTLSKNQRQLQVNRLGNNYVLWTTDFELGITENGALEEAFKDLEDRPAYSTIKPPVPLSLFEHTSFQYTSKTYSILNKNLPKEIEDVYVGIEFYTAYVHYIVNKIEAIEALIRDSGVTPQPPKVVNKLKDDQSVEENKVTVFVKNDSREYLINQLSPYVSEDSQKSLSDLICGKSIDNPITIHCKQNVLGEIFYMAYEDRLIQSFKATLSKWICQHFQRQIDGQIYPLTYSTMLNHLKGVGFNQN